MYLYLAEVYFVVILVAVFTPGAGDPVWNSILPMVHAEITANTVEWSAAA